MKSCSKCREEKPASEFYATGNTRWCKACLRARKTPQSLPRALRNRARHRATGWLIDKHADEFDQLVAQAKAECEAEAAALAAAYDGPEAFPRLKSGARRPGEEVVDRLDVARCPHCINNHDKGHVCRYCGGSPDQAPAAAKGDLGQAIDRMLAAGKSQNEIMIRLGIDVARYMRERRIA